jgi:hypothetical protein
LILDERGDRSVAPELKEIVRTAGDPRHALRALWALNNIEALDEEFARGTLSHTNPWLRAWAVRLLGQRDTAPTAETWSELVRLARSD